MKPSGTENLGEVGAQTGNNPLWGRGGVWIFSGTTQWRCLKKDLVVVLSSLHTNRNKLKGSEDFI